MRCQLTYAPPSLWHIILPCWIALASPVRWHAICLEEITLA
jgi:hypothetical protein